MRIRIESPDGTAENTRIFDAETGKLIGRVRRAEIVIEAGMMARANLEIVELHHVDAVVDGKHATVKFIDEFVPAAGIGLDGLNLGPVV